jgi:uncharacterized protein (DUF1697 family)
MSSKLEPRDGVRPRSRARSGATRGAGAQRYVALLRGINVGGKNLVPMPALQAFFLDEGFVDVATYIQSGNVLFSSPDAVPALEPRLEEALSRAFGFQATVVVRSADALGAVVDAAPAGFGSRPDQHRYDVVFLKAPLTAATAVEGIRAKPGVDRVFAGEGVLYFSRLIARASQSHLTRIVGTPAYRSMTIRNWNTTTRLAALAGAAPTEPTPPRGSADPRRPAGARSRR